MGMGFQVRRLLSIIAAYHLDDRHPDEVGPIKQRAEQGDMSEYEAEIFIHLVFIEQGFILGAEE